MSLTASFCMYCESRNDLIDVATVATGSGPGWSYYACRACRISERLVPLVAHPSNSWGGLHYWPEPVPHELVVLLAGLGDGEELRAVNDRLFPAVAAASAARRHGRETEYEVAAAIVEAAVADLRALAGPGLTPVPDGP